LEGILFPLKSELKSACLSFVVSSELTEEPAVVLSPVLVSYQVTIPCMHHDEQNFHSNTNFIVAFSLISLGLAWFDLVEQPIVSEKLVFRFYCNLLAVGEAG
jgi:hypothetical protein